MLHPVSDGAERAENLAAKLGCTVVWFCEPYGPLKPALLGSFGAFASTLKEFGGRWNREDKVYFFGSWPLLEAAMRHVIDQRERTHLRE